MSADDSLNIREELQGWEPELTSEERLRDAIGKAFDYRGDVTLQMRSGLCVECYLFNRVEAPTLAESYVQYFVANDPAKHKVAYDQIVRLVFTGKDRAAGKHWEDWVKSYQERKAQGEALISLEADPID